MAHKSFMQELVPLLTAHQLVPLLRSQPYIVSHSVVMYRALAAFLAILADDVAAQDAAADAGVVPALLQVVIMCLCWCNIALRLLVLEITIRLRPLTAATRDQAVPSDGTQCSICCRCSSPQEMTDTTERQQRWTRSQPSCGAAPPLATPRRSRHASDLHSRGSQRMFTTSTPMHS